MTFTTIVLEVIGEQPSHCSSCENTIRRGLELLPGVRRVKPSLKTQRIELALDAAQTPLEAVREKLDRMGWRTRDPEEGSG